jgi:hypothetical protein
MFEIEVSNAISEGCDCAEDCCRPTGIEEYIIDSPTYLICADYCKVQVEKDLVFENAEHADLYVKVLDFFGVKGAVKEHNGNCVTTFFINEYQSIFFFRLFRYFRVDEMINMLKDMITYDLQPWNALVFSYLVHQEKVKGYLYEDFEIFEQKINPLFYTFISEEEFKAKLNRDHTKIFKACDSRNVYGMTHHFPRFNEEKREIEIKKREAWEKVIPQLQKTIENKDYEKYANIRNEWIKENL